MRSEKKILAAANQDYEAIGVPAVWIPALQKMGFMTIESLKDANANKVFNDLGGVRKKLKIEDKLPAKADIENWISAS
jgi:lysyl-tRNA synthetase class 2